MWVKELLVMDKKKGEVIKINVGDKKYKVDTREKSFMVHIWNKRWGK